MGLSNQLVVFPLIVLTICVIMSGAGGLTSQQGLAYSGAAAFCQGGGSSSSGLGCTPSNTNSSATQGTVYTCHGTTSCQLPYVCPHDSSGYHPPAPSFCVSAVWFVPPGQSVLIPSSLVPSLGPTINPGQNLVFGDIQATGFIIMVSAASIIVALGALQFFGSGENAEGIHIAWMTALLLGLWTILSAAEGFITATPTSFFVELNGYFANVGSLSYMFLTLLFTLGTIGSVSRSSGSGGGV